MLIRILFGTWLGHGYLTGLAIVVGYLGTPNGHAQIFRLTELGRTEIARCLEIGHHVHEKEVETWTGEPPTKKSNFFEEVRPHFLKRHRCADKAPFTFVNEQATSLLGGTDIKTAVASALAQVKQNKVKSVCCGSSFIADAIWLSPWIPNYGNFGL